MALLTLGVMFVAFGVLARICPCNPEQPRFVSRNLADNALYWVLALLFYGGVISLYIHAGAGLIAPQAATRIAGAILAGYGPVSRLPLLAQALIIIVSVDFVQYWAHRLFHSHALWPFHAIHHSPEDLDWTATFRNHPINFLLYSSGVFALIRVGGFSSEAFVIIGPFNLLYGALVHANLNWTFGPFRYLIASPVYHRWHHVKDPAGYDSNFAPTFPVWDLMFGTCYLPDGQLPRDYGVDDVPRHFLLQLLYPFRVYAERAGLWRKAVAEAAARPS
jgi:sterol desaturase/sphingolipid hydroxylase (fatty acid hydroxylase superfamily)